MFEICWSQGFASGGSLELRRGADNTGDDKVKAADPLLQIQCEVGRAVTSPSPAAGHTVSEATTPDTAASALKF